MVDEIERPKINKKMVAGGAGIIGIITAFTSIVFAYIDTKTSSLDRRIEDRYAATKEYVDLKHDEVRGKLENIENLLIKIDDRIYQLNKNK